MGRPPRERPKNTQDAKRSLGQGRIWIRRKGKGIWQVDGDDARGDFDRGQPAEERLGSAGSVTKEDTRSIADPGGCELAKKLRRLGNYTAEIFAVDMFASRGSPKERSSAKLTIVFPCFKVSGSNPGSRIEPGGRKDELGIRGFENSFGTARFADRFDAEDLLC